VPEMNLATLTQSVAQVPASVNGLMATGLSLDSRTIENGGVFVALQGLASDGREYIDAAFARGAVAVLAEAEGLESSDSRVIPVQGLKAQLGEIARRFYADPSKDLSLLAVTGTNGKTSITDYTGQLLRLLGASAGTIGTLGARTRAGKAADAQNTTPDILSLNQYLAEWRDEGVRHVAIEASSHALEQGRLDGLTVHTGVFSNLTRDHLDYHGDLESYRSAKLRLFNDFLPSRIIYNEDDEATREAREATSSLAFGLSFIDPSADVYVKVMSETLSGLEFQIHSPFGTADIKTALHGRFNAFNITAAAVAVTGLGFPFTEVANAASYLLPVDGRMQEVKGGSDIRVVVDYAHTPDALASALSALKQSCTGALWVVFGCGGDRDAGKRPEMGRIADSLADQLVVTNDNPRSESPEMIAEDIMVGITGSPCHVELDRGAAIRYAVLNARPGDTVLITGKGHENYQLVGNNKLDFSDVSYAAQVLREREVAHA
jgi:UDP-N-acetylmuramoyl-L-alanyl-D-glutamate--2,6-diaminopimelate ligase